MGTAIERKKKSGQKVKDFEDGGMQIRETGIKRRNREERAGRKKETDGARLKQRGAVIAVKIAWKLLDQVSNWTSFSVRLSVSAASPLPLPPLPLPICRSPNSK